jgi:hypothetical protein
LNFGTTGTVICGGGSGAILEALPTPLGSTITLFIPPALPGPCGMPLIGTFPLAAPPAILADEAAGMLRTTNNAKAAFTVVFDMGSSMIHENV